MKAKYFFFFVLCYFAITSENIAQNTTDSIIPKKNVIFYEIAGSGGKHSLNYERLFPLKQQACTISIRGGVGFPNLTDYKDEFNPDFVVPIMLNAMYGKKHRAEIGVGQTISSMIESNASTGDPKRATNFNTTFNIGYRYQRPSGGPMFRAGYTPIINFRGEYFHWFGVSAGYTF